jgi:hypothetical protein
VEDFAVAYLNGSVKPNLAERNPTDGRIIEYLMDGPQLGRLDKREVWSYSNATGTGYQYRVTYRDKRFSNLDDLLAMYSGRVRVEENDMPAVEQRLYELILVLINEGRLPKNFKIRPAKDPQLDRFLAELEQLGWLLNGIDERVKRLESQMQSEEGYALTPPSNQVS